MYRLFGFWLFLLPFSAWSQEHFVPAGTSNNKLILLLKNTSTSQLSGAYIGIQSSPEWARFEPKTRILKPIPLGEEIEVVFEFQVLEGEEQRIGSVQIVITDSSGHFLAERIFRLRSYSQPKSTKLIQPFPNPANLSTSISYELHAPSHVKLEVYNILGQLVRQLVNEDRPAGTFTIQWDGQNDQGFAVSTGTYIVRLTTQAKDTNKIQQFTSKVTLQK